MTRTNGFRVVVGALAIAALGAAAPGCKDYERRADPEPKLGNPLDPGGVDAASFLDGVEGFAGREGYTGSGGGRYAVREGDPDRADD